MSCEQTRRLLDEYIDDSLTQRAREVVEAHLSECTECGHEAGVLRSLIARARALPDSVEPSRDLWPEIACRLDGGAVVRATPARASVWRGVLAASIVTAAALGVIALTRTFLDGQPGGQTVEATRDVGAALTEAKQGLRATFEQRKATLPPEATAEVERNLKIIEKAIEDIRVAVERDPDNHKLSQMLYAAQRREVGVLQQFTRHTFLF